MNPGWGTLASVVCVLGLAAKFLPHEPGRPLADPTVRSEVKKAASRLPDRAPATRKPAESSGKATTFAAARHPASAGMQDKPGNRDRPVVFNSPWNGSVWQVERYLKRSLHDAASFEAIAWGPVTGAEKGYRVWCTYKSKNVLGIYVTQTKTFLLRKNGDVYAVED